MAFNTSGEHRSADMWVDGVISPAGTALADELDPGYTSGTYKPQEG